MSSSTPNGTTDRASELKLGQHVGERAPKQPKTFTEEEIGTHNSETDCWMIIHGIVYDTSKFLEVHPGGPEIMLQNAGIDATNEFEQVFHSAQARGQLADYVIGVVKGYDGPLDAVVNQSSAAGSGTATKTETTSG